MTRAEAIESAAVVYRAILADPERAEQIRAHRAAAATSDPRVAQQLGGAARPGTSTTQ